MPYTCTAWDVLPQVLKDDFNEIICWNGSSVSTILREAMNIVPSCAMPPQSDDNKTCLPSTRAVITANRTAYEAGPLSSDRKNFEAHCINNYGQSQNDKELMKSCWHFADYQLNNWYICRGNRKVFQREGFQIGSPWHGDVLQAPVMFLSSNPGITHRCLFPRWHPDKNLYTLGGADKYGNELYDITYKDDNNQPVQIHNLLADNRAVYDFLARRFQTTFLNANSGLPSAWVIQDDNTCTNKRNVPFWADLRRIMNWLLQIAGANEIDHTRRLMRCVLSAEVIPFGSQGEDGVNNDAMDYFMKRYTLRLLQNCGAGILFLAGSKTREAFFRATGINVSNGEVLTDVSVSLAGHKRVFQLAGIDGANKHGVKNHFEVCQAMRNARANSGTLLAKLARANALYSL